MYFCKLRGIFGRVFYAMCSFDRNINRFTCLNRYFAAINSDCCRALNN